MKDLARLKWVLAIKNGNTANVAKKHIGSLQFQPNQVMMNGYIDR